jgi:hypothetical protein
VRLSSRWHVLPDVLDAAGKLRAYHADRFVNLKFVRPGRIEGASMLPTAYVAHRLPGRLRLTIPAMRGNRAYFDALTETLEGLEGVTAVSSRPTSASVVIEHAAATQEDIALLTSTFVVLVKKEKDRKAGDESKPSPKERSALRATTLGFAGMAAYQVVRGRYASSAVENLWNAYGALRTLRRPWVALGYAAVGLHQMMDGKVLASALSLAFYSLSAKKMAEGDGEAAT